MDLQPTVCGHSYAAPGFSDVPRYVRGALTDGDVYEDAVAVTTWSIASLVALLVFQQSMRRCRVRTVHVFRVWIYAVILVIPPAAFVGYAGSYADAFFVGFFIPLNVPVAAGLVCLAALSLYLGYQHYLRMPRSGLVVAASQTIAILTSTIVGLRLACHGQGERVLRISRSPWPGVTAAGRNSNDES